MLRFLSVLYFLAPSILMAGECANKQAFHSFIEYRNTLAKSLEARVAGRDTSDIDLNQYYDLPFMIQQRMEEWPSFEGAKELLSQDLNGYDDYQYLLELEAYSLYCRKNEVDLVLKVNTSDMPHPVLREASIIVVKMRWGKIYKIQYTDMEDSVYNKQGLYYGQVFTQIKEEDKRVMSKKRFYDLLGLSE